MHIRSSILTLIITAGLFTFQIEAADFLPLYVNIPGKSYRNHWLSNRFLQNHGRNATALGCIEVLEGIAGSGRWLSDALFDSPETNILFMLKLHEGGHVSNKTPFENHFSFPPGVFAQLGARLFKAYSRLPIPSLSLYREAWDPPYNRWEELFAQEDLLRGFGGVHTLIISADALPALAASRSFPNLETLWVGPSESGPLVAVLNSAHFPKLRRLVLNSAELSAIDLRTLLTAQGFSSIKELSLRNVNFGDEGLTIMASLPTLSHLEALALDSGSPALCDNRPTEVGLQSLFESPHLVGLKKLSIEAIWKFGPEAMNHLANWLGLEQLEYLELHASENGIGIARMLQSRRLSHLRELRLQGTIYEDSLLLALAKNSSLTSLERVVIDLSPDITRDTVKRVLQSVHLRSTNIAYDMEPLVLP